MESDFEIVYDGGAQPVNRICSSAMSLKKAWYPEQGCWVFSLMRVSVKLFVQQKAV